MLRIIFRKSFCLTLLTIFSRAEFAQNLEDQWLTKAEISGFDHTSSYEETVDFCERLEKASLWIKLTSIGESAGGYSIPLMIVSKDKIFDPIEMYKSSKTVILIQNGINSREIEGKDACLMHVRDLTILKRYPHWLDSVILLILPIYNVDGSQCYNQIHQMR